MGSYPMQIMPVFEIVEASKFYSHLPTLRTFTPTKRLFLRTLLVLLSAVAAMLVPKFGLFINLIGAFACTALAFILPVQMYNKTHKDTITKKWRYTHYLLVFFGVVCGTISFILSVYELVRAFSEHDESAEQIAKPTENNVVTEIDLNAALRNSTSTTVMTPGPGLKF